MKPIYARPDNDINLDILLGALTGIAGLLFGAAVMAVLIWVAT